MPSLRLKKPQRIERIYEPPSHEGSRSYFLQDFFQESHDDYPCLADLWKADSSSLKS